MSKPSRCACSGCNGQVLKYAANMQGYSFDHITSSGSVKRLFRAETELSESLGQCIKHESEQSRAEPCAPLYSALPPRRQHVPEVGGFPPEVQVQHPAGCVGAQTVYYWVRPCSISDYRKSTNTCDVSFWSLQSIFKHCPARHPTSRPNKHRAFHQQQISSPSHSLPRSITYKQ